MHDKFQGSRRSRKHRRRRSGTRIEAERLFGAICGFVAITFAILLLPFGLFGAGVKRLGSGRSSSGTGSARSGNNRGNASVKTDKKAKKAKNAADKDGKRETRLKEVKPKEFSLAPKKKRVAPKSNASRLDESAVLLGELAFEKADRKIESHSEVERDESEPKATPRSESDKYIRKRMILAHTDRCDSNARALLRVESELKVEADAENPDDPGAVKLTLDGRAVGYAAKEDRNALSTCLKLGRSIYAIITDVRLGDGEPEYEFEAFIEAKK